MTEKATGISVIVCGSRNYEDAWTLCRVLDRLHAARPIWHVAHGDATGADELGAHWAMSRGISHREFAANWKLHGRAAGPIRNREMLVLTAPDLVVAFPGGAGTADMVRQARAAGVEVLEVAASQPSAPRGGVR